MNTKIMFCGCEHKFQDKQYGSHMRVHNRTKQGGKSKTSGGAKTYRCTVCGTTK